MAALHLRITNTRYHAGIGRKRDTLVAAQRGNVVLSYSHTTRGAARGGHCGTCLQCGMLKIDELDNAVAGADGDEIAGGTCVHGDSHLMTVRTGREVARRCMRTCSRLRT